MATIDSVDGWLEQAQLLEDLYQAIESIRAPTVAVIEGYALGSGLIMALACDLRICTPSARLGAPAAATLGNCLALGEYARIVRILGPTRARQMLLLAMILDAEQALDWGMVTEVVDSERLEARVGEVAGEAGRPCAAVDVGDQGGAAPPDSARRGRLRRRAQRRARESRLRRGPAGVRRPAAADLAAGLMAGTSEPPVEARRDRSPSVRHSCSTRSWPGWPRKPGSRPFTSAAAPWATPREPSRPSSR